MSHIFGTIGVTSITDVTDASKALAIDLTGASVDTTTTMIYSQTANRTWTWPDVTSTVTGIDTTQTITNKTIYEPTSNTITAAGTTQATATALTAMNNVVTTVAANTGVSLPVSLFSGLRCIVVNRGANALRVYPAVGARIDALAINAFTTILSNGFATYESSSATQWYTVTTSVNVSGTTNQVTATAATGGFTISTPTTFVAPGSITATTTLTATTFYQDGTVNAITAAGTTQATATALTRSYNVVTTTAAGTGVRFPTGVIGMRIIVVNRGANTLNVYPATGAQIDALGANIADPILTNGFAIFQAATTTQWYTVAESQIGGSVVNSVSGTANQVTATPTTGAVVVSTPSTFIGPGTIQDTTGMLYSTSNGLTATGTNQGTALALTTSWNVVTTVAAGTGVIMPTPSVGGYVCVITNQGANNLNVYPNTGARINTQAINASYLLAPNNVIAIYAATTTQWYSSAGISPGSGLSSLLTEVNSGTTFNTSSATDVLITGMTYTIPIANPITKCMVIFNGSGGISANGTATYSVYYNGVLVTNSGRDIQPPGSNAVATVATQAVITPVAIGGVIEIRVRTTAGTVTVSNRSMAVLGVA